MKIHKLTENLGLKVLALFFAVMLWLIVVNVDDPEVEKTFHNIPVTVVNEEVVLNTGKTYQIVDDMNTVSVTVQAQRSEMSKISAEDIIATADLSQMEVSIKMVPISAAVSGYEDAVAEVIPKNLRITIEDVTSNTFPISVSTNGTPRDGYVLGDMTVNPENVKIKGAESVINSIEKVVALVNVSGISQSSVLDAELVCYDVNGEIVDQTRLSNNLGIDGVSVNVQILNTKSVNLDFHVSGTPAKGYAFTDVSSEPSKVQVYGTKEALDQIDSIEIPASEIDITGAKARMEVTVDISPYLPDGVRLTDENASNVTVTVLIEQEGKRVIELPVESIEVKNLSDKLTISMDKQSDLMLTFIGPKEILDTLDIRNAASINLKNYTSAGEYDVPLDISLSSASGVELDETYSVHIVLSKKDADNTEGDKAADNTSNTDGSGGSDSTDASDSTDNTDNTNNTTDKENDNSADE